MSDETPAAPQTPAPAPEPPKVETPTAVGDPFVVHEIVLDEATPDINEWQKTILAMGGKAPPAPKPAPAPTPRTPPPTPTKEGLSRYEQLCKTPSMQVKSKDYKVIDEFSDILSNVNTALNALKKFETEHPYLVAPNVFRIVEDALKESSTILFREFHNLRNGVKQKTYERKYVCSECHSVFMVPLPDNVCDECRGKKAHGLAPY